MLQRYFLLRVIIDEQLFSPVQKLMTLQLACDAQACQRSMRCKQQLGTVHILHTAREGSLATTQDIRLDHSRADWKPDPPRAHLADRPFDHDLKDLSLFLGSSFPCSDFACFL